MVKINTEAKIGIIGVITAAIIIWGISYLKGQNVLSSKNRYVTFYDQIDGLEPSADVVLRGYKIGIVDDIIFDTENKPHFTVYLEIDKNYKIRKGSLAEIHSSDLLGSKAIRIIQSSSLNYADSRDTLSGTTETDMIDGLMNDIQPITGKINRLTTTIDSLGQSLNSIISGPELSASLRNISLITSSLKNQLSESGSLGHTLENFKVISDSLRNETASVTQTISNLNAISENLKNARLDSLLFEVRDVASGLADISDGINSGDGTLGKLIQDDSIYNHLNIFIADLDSLINDINKNPKKYVHFSIF